MTAYFISDTHLGARGSDERRLVAWLEEIAASESEPGQLWLLGDMIDFWWEWRLSVPRGYTRFLGTLARMADSGWRITWLKGNHDLWIRDYLPSELGVTVVEGVVIVDILGSRFLMEHGDGVGRLPRGYRFLRSLFRNSLARAAFSCVHPRWSLAIANAWSSHSRAHGMNGTRPEPLIEFADEYARRHPDIRYFVFGHYHHPLQQKLDGTNADITVLGDCVDGRFSYARFDGSRLGLVQ